MDDAVFFKAKIAGKTYTLTKLTLGQARLLKSQFDLQDLSAFTPSDPDHLVGALYLCLREEKPDASALELLAEIEALDIESFEDVEETPAEEDAGSPLDEAAAEASEPPAASELETIPAPPGTPS